MDTPVKKYLDETGKRFVDASKETGLPAPTIGRHYHGDRWPDRRCARIYHEKWGIPLEDFEAPFLPTPQTQPQDGA